jgi:hypothetical protein
MLSVHLLFLPSTPLVSSNPQENGLGNSEVGRRIDVREAELLDVLQ